MSTDLWDLLPCGFAPNVSDTIFVIKGFDSSDAASAFGARDCSSGFLCPSQHVLSQHPEIFNLKKKKQPRPAVFHYDQACLFFTGSVFCPELRCYQLPVTRRIFWGARLLHILEDGELWWRPKLPVWLACMPCGPRRLPSGLAVLVGAGQLFCPSLRNVKRASLFRRGALLARAPNVADTIEYF